MTCYSIEARTKNISNDMDFFHLREIYLTNMEKNYLILLLKQD